MHVLDELHLSLYSARSQLLTGAPDLVRKMDNSVEEKIKAGPPFAEANLALTKAGNVSSNPNCMMIRYLVSVRRELTGTKCKLSRGIQNLCRHLGPSLQLSKTSQDDSSSISITQRIKHHRD
jgi:hypothetical protein